MLLFRRLLTLIAAVVVIGTGAVVANASVYDTPGGQIQNGRLWNTECEMYSSNVVRCRTEIWATQVVYHQGTYQRVTGWTFNNLTYLPSPRAAWADNNLGHSDGPNVVWTSSGRSWRTECDTPNTGRGACRSYILADVATATVVGGRWVYSTQRKWVFNNLVLFSSPTIPPVTSAPAHILDQSVLTHTGFGPLGLNARTSDLQKLGYIDWKSTSVCEYWDVSSDLADRGIALTYNNNAYVMEVILTRAGEQTAAGAQVGMTLDEVRAIYGASAVKLETKDGYEPVYVAVVDQGRYELVFVSSFELSRPMVGTDRISMIIAREATDWLGWDGC
ncbi:hypothetical protein LKO27_00445 [Tessaracoccus sp. OS52]|uniref:hypothetical protein n=1 Tax=Tessaracoccus sp. OS52 TaxID=2886691 RepID=UPI001D107646|nr:hypothetical protein [Tessaracoccus sp. OS52]MCC2591900.1 hypothetical protein [Tessaracoccus sp. OS52]